MLWAGIFFSKHQVATELGVNSQIQIGSISIAIMLMFNFMLMLPILTSADKIFARLVRYCCTFYSAQSLIKDNGFLVLDKFDVLRDSLLCICCNCP